MTEIIISTSADGNLVVDSRSIASQLGIQHKNFLATIRNYQNQIQQAFGQLAFQTQVENNKSNNPEKFVLLTEDQATFLMTLSRNTPEVVRCKILLVKKFSEAKKLLAEQKKISFTEAIMVADYAAKSALNAGVDESIIEQIKLDSLVKNFPEFKDFLLAQKKSIAASNPLPEAPMTATEVGQELAVKMGLVSISARKVNKKLLDLGYQVSVTRVKRSNGKETHHYYKATPKGSKYSTLLLNAYQDGDGKATKPQLRWFCSIVEVLKNNWE